MANDDYFSEGRYRCNHPESDFVDNSKGPIEMKKENFVEYTHRNETANYRYDVWSGGDSASKTSYSASTSSSRYNSLNNQYSQNGGYNTATPNYSNQYNKTSSKKKSNNLGCLIVFVFWGLPFIFGILGAIFEMISEIF